MCGESGTAPAGMPQFIEARAVDTIQDCDFDHLQIRLSLFSSAHVDPAILHTAKCTLMFPPRNQNSPPHHCAVRLRLPLRIARSPCILKIAATCPRGPQVQTPRENNTIIFN